MLAFGSRGDALRAFMSEQAAKLGRHIARAQSNAKFRVELTGIEPVTSECHENKNHCKSKYLERFASAE